MTRCVSRSLLLAGGLAALVCAAVAPAPQRRAKATAPSTAGAVGMSLFFQNGSIAPLTLVGDAPRYLQEVDIVATTPPSPNDTGVASLIQGSEFSTLDWTGVSMVEEDWRPSGDGTFQRQRFYRGARWMERASRIHVVPIDDQGREVGPPLIARAGSDDRWKQSDDGFVRRFVVRQIARGCPAVGNTTGASFTVQGLVQFRDSLRPDDAQVIPARATALRLRWSEQPGVSRTVPVTRAEPSAFTFGYGFQTRLKVVNPPANRRYYLLGDVLTIRLSFLDGSGRRVFPKGTLLGLSPIKRLNN
jgi:hypothetical protein